MLHFYYYVPPCPKCGSRRTGRYIKRPITDSGFIKEKSLKMGELVRFAPSEPIKNAFCEDCGYEWGTRIITMLWPSVRIQKEIDERGTAIRYNEYMRKKTMAQKAAAKTGFFASMFGRSAYVPDDDEVDFSDAVRTPNVTDDVLIVDRRKQRKVELLYADEELIKKVLEVQNGSI